jgi:hypothetical protein
MGVVALNMPGTSASLTACLTAPTLPFFQPISPRPSHPSHPAHPHLCLGHLVWVVHQQVQGPGQSTARGLMTCTGKQGGAVSDKG